MSVIASVLSLAQKGLLRRLSPRNARAGAIAIVTACCAPLLMMIVGFVIDFAYASYINQRLARATDAATLGSVSQTAATAGGGYGDTAFLQSFGVNYFNANTTQLGVSGVNFSLTVASDGAGGVTAIGTYTCNVPTFFAGVLGINNIPVSGSAKTSARPPSYVNYYVLIDISQSMGIASTAADMTRLYNLVVSTGNGTGGETGCVFGCHVTQLNNSGAMQSVSNEVLAHTANPPIQLRIDAAVAAVKSIVTQAQAIAGTTLNIKFAIYTMQEAPGSVTVLQPILSPPSTNYAAVQTATSSIDLGMNNSNGRGDTDIPNELLAFQTTLTAAGVLTNGSGASATSPLNYFFIVTDGVVDTYGPCHALYMHCTSALDPTNCLPLKLRGTVGIIYTIYSPIWANNNPSGLIWEQSYKDLVSGLAAQIKPALQSCATSSDFYFEANDGPDIVTAMQNLFQRTQPTSARITQ